MSFVQESDLFLLSWTLLKWRNMRYPFMLGSSLLQIVFFQWPDFSGHLRTTPLLNYGVRTAFWLDHEDWWTWKTSWTWLHDKAVPASKSNMITVGFCIFLDDETAFWKNTTSGPVHHYLVISPVFLNNTLPETNIPPENRPLEHDIP